MNGFENGRLVEAEGLRRLRPFLEERAHGLVFMNKGPLAKHLQETYGDVMFNSDPDRVFSIEVKTEKRHTGNLFLETWSNKNLDSEASHFARGSNRGWLEKLLAELLFYYFLDTDDLYIFKMFPLQRWAFGDSSSVGNIHRFKEVCQRKHDQMNDTHGRLVPLEVLKSEVGYKHAKPRQLLLAFEAAE